MSIQQFKPGDVPARVPRGSACLSCRRRKMRCDGVRPVCGQCVNMEREFDCEYTDGPNPSPTQVLERHVARLEARITELEQPQPERQPSQRGGHSRLQSLNLSSVRASQPPSSRRSTSSTPGTSASVISSDPSIEPHLAVVRLLVSIFVPHASQVGFFLHQGRFLDAVYNPESNIRRTALSPSLLDAVLLWGAHLSTNDSVRAHESTFLSRAIKSIADALPQVVASQLNIIHIIQAEVLLSTYFFCQNRLLEGTYHCGAAVALSLSCRLHKIRSNMDDTGSSTILTLPAATDAIQEGERINAFWAVYALDRSWSVAQGFLANDVYFGVQIDTPWPLEMGMYDEGLPAALRGYNTMQTFLSGPVDRPAVQGVSIPATRAKAAALFEYATRLASQWSPSMQNLHGFYVEVLRLDNLIRHFLEALLPLNHPEVTSNSDLAVTLLVTHTLARVAVIRLHANFSGADSGREGEDLLAAKAVVAALEMVNLDEVPFVDPILAILWYAVCQVLIASIAKFGVSTVEREELLQALQKIVNTMSKHAPFSELMHSQAQQVQQDAHTIGLTINL